ncbi:phenylacetate--CoA ligase family protein [Sediminispirochaeta smaragdinae]|uniref:Coenzyme F390 synthetase n=1 Tax=Sediminispirochaeta smaragdinae (strain DSM 11293 / JCM 15392 / SEBR 4228) TaxID=573413 RepID=E1R106_SEDSS|nr:hypothetical protein [Sediminispirochaeta smaragdinae]ADK80255.1 Coenzyme F390 synthetase [Sediminispirochaeta smaragdinae DSM 11293]
MQGNKTIRPVLDDSERFPGLEDLRWVYYLRQHPKAPLYNFKSGDRLDSDGVERLHGYKRTLRKLGGTSSLSFIRAFYKEARSDVPAYRNYPADFNDAPSMNRDDLRKAPWDYVKDSASLENILCYATSGTTGAPLEVIFDATCASSWLPQVELMLEKEGLGLEKGAGTTAVALICYQLETLTYASASSYLEGSGFIKVNLHPKQWRAPSDASDYLLGLDPGLLTGDPLAFSALMELEIPLRPRAMISSAMTLSEGLAVKLEEYFHCPVYDVYSMTECRNIAFKRRGIMEKMRPDLYLEILAPGEERVLEEGAWGELAVSGGNNPYLPLIRYRTGDFCRLRNQRGRQFLEDFQGRLPVRFPLPHGGWINTIDFSRALAPLALASFQIAQQRDFSLVVRYGGRGKLSREIGKAIGGVLEQYGAEDLPFIFGEPLPEISGKKICSFVTEFER